MSISVAIAREEEMSPSRYGERFQEHLLEQYKLYVQMADNISARRADSNQFYIKVLSALLAVVTLVTKLPTWNAHSHLQVVADLAIILLAVVLCGVWWINLESYKQLNSGKFLIVHEMEKSLPFRCYDTEWDELQRGRSRGKYWPLTHIERYIPIIVSIPFLVLLGCLIADWVK